VLIVALVLAVIGLAALVTAVVTSNELVAWVCIAASVIGVILLIIDAIRDRRRTRMAAAEEEAAPAMLETGATVDETYENFDAEYPGESEREAEFPDEAEPAAVWAGDAQTHPAIDESPGDEVLEEAEPTESDAESTVETDTAVEVRYVTSDEADATMQVRYVTDEDADVADVAGKNAADADTKPDTD
jgi:hypothetical protein